MKVSRLAPLALCLFSPFVGCDCGKDDAGGGDASGSESSGSESTGLTSSTTVGMTAADGTGTSAGSDETAGGSGTGAPTEVFVSGTVVDYTMGMMSIPDVEITVHGMPGITATTDAMGAFMLGPLPPETPISIIAAPSTDYFGTVLPYMTLASDDEDAEVPQVSRAFVDSQIMLIMDQNPAPADLMQGIMIVGNQLMPDLVGAVIDVQPAPPPDTYYAPDAMGAPVVGESTLAFELLPVVIYFNVPDYQPGEVTVDATHPSLDCAPAVAEFPTIGEHVTLVLVEC